MKQMQADTLISALSSHARETRSPVAATFELTYGCNLRCVHCYNPTHRVLPHELTTEEVRSILDQLEDLGVIHLILTGGEPFTRPDILDILQDVKRLGFVLSVISNATRITVRLADALKELPLESVCVSMYGATKTSFERVTGIPGSYDAFMRGFECLASRGVPVVVRMPVVTENCEEVQQARTFVEHSGFKFQYCLDIMPKTNADTAPLQYRLSPADKVRINQNVMGSGGPAPAGTLCPRTQGFISCSCGQNRFAITPYGEMNLCAGFPIPKYDLRKGTVRQGWEVLKQTVDEARPNEHYECPSCDVRSYCQQGRNDAWLETGDMSACLPHFLEFARLEKRATEYLDPRRPA